MLTDHDAQKSFQNFMDGFNRLMADAKFREVLLELDSSGEKAIDLLGSDPAAFLRYQGVAIPEDFRVAVETHSEAAARGTRTVRYCLRICWWRWCVSICISRTTTTNA
jgi:hypothetical protein